MILVAIAIDFGGGFGVFDGNMGDSSYYFKDFACEFGWDFNVKGGNFDNLKGFGDVFDDLSHGFGGYLYVFLVISMISVVDRMIEKNEITSIKIFISIGQDLWK